MKTTKRWRRPQKLRWPKNWRRTEKWRRHQKLRWPKKLGHSQKWRQHKEHGLINITWIFFLMTPQLDRHSKQAALAHCLIAKIDFEKYATDPEPDMEKVESLPPANLHFFHVWAKAQNYWEGGPLTYFLNRRTIGRDTTH